jgi:hypothetical protein
MSAFTKRERLLSRKRIVPFGVKTDGTTDLTAPGHFETFNMLELVPESGRAH